jgi:hypothetical protein
MKECSISFDSPTDSIDYFVEKVEQQLKKSVQDATQSLKTEIKLQDKPNSLNFIVMEYSLGYVYAGS